LLLFAGCQLGLTIMDLDNRKDFFVVLFMLGITLAANLAAGFLVGVVVAWVLKAEKLHV
jgi:SulP family sulfate permease